MLIGTPDEMKARNRLETYMAGIVTEKGVSIEIWVEGLDLLRNYVSRYLFPAITLRTFLEQEMFRGKPAPKLTGDGPLFHEQGYFDLITIGKSHVIAGLTRSGSWVMGGADVVGIHITGLSLQQVSSRELAEFMMPFFEGKPLAASVAFMAERVSEFIKRDIHDKRMRLKDLDRSSEFLSTFVGLISIKAAQTAA